MLFQYYLTKMPDNFAQTFLREFQFDFALRLLGRNRVDGFSELPIIRI